MKVVDQLIAYCEAQGLLTEEMKTKLRGEQWFSPEQIVREKYDEIISRIMEERRMPCWHKDLETICEMVELCHRKSLRNLLSTMYEEVNVNVNHQNLLGDKNYIGAVFLGMVKNEYDHAKEKEEERLANAGYRDDPVSEFDSHEETEYKERELPY